MTRNIVLSTEEARKEISDNRTYPAWLENQHSLPFNSLSSDEFEILSYLLLCKENPDAKVFYYGKTGDAGRDIVIEKTDGTKELIQCKCYSNNVGLTQIKAELAKLYCNVFYDKIPIKPDKIIFFVVPDITAPAQDFIDTESHWLQNVEEIIKKHLKIQKNPEIDYNLLEFARQWYPPREKQIGVDLTQRIKFFPELIEEFFGFKKVIDTESLKPLENKLDKHDEKLDKTNELIKQLSKQLSQHQLLVSPTLDNAPELFQKIINDIESKNPLLKINLSANSEITRIVIQAKQTVPIGTLTFDKSPGGIKGQNKYLSLINEGRNIELLPGEYKWVWDDQISLPEMDGNLQIIPNIPDKKVPVKIILTQDNVEVFSIDFANLSIVRMGKLELEFKISSTFLLCEIGMIVSFLNNKVNIYNVDYFDLTSISSHHDIQKVINFFELITLINKGAELSIFSLEYAESALFDRGKAMEKFDDIEKADNTLNIFRKIQKINKELNLNIHFPTSDNDLRYINELFDYLETGKMTITNSSLNIKNTTRKNIRILENSSQGILRLDMSYGNTQYEIQEKEILINLENHYLEIKSSAITKIKELENNIQNLSDNDLIDVEIYFSKAVLSKT
ncbi:restriction endonuclease [Crocosphaera sp.]|uniref:restriction endonuclease n=1 Tax=Crocosphaera sp. TaxID=2729996 RepID=UPI00262D7A13|nr:restriction endonuclease [Crocosphaera sp.]MDJ0582500.1 restriction endonuclease [Crocosphaera sp.]